MSFGHLPDRLTGDGALPRPTRLHLSHRERGWRAGMHLRPLQHPPAPLPWGVAWAGVEGGHEILAAACPVHRPSSFLRLRSWHPGFICALRVKAISNSLLSLICSRIKGWGVGGTAVQAGARCHLSGWSGVLRAAAPVGPVRGAKVREQAGLCIVKPKARKSEGPGSPSEGGGRRGRAGRAVAPRRGQAELLKRRPVPS